MINSTRDVTETDEVDIGTAQIFRGDTVQVSTRTHVQSRRGDLVYGRVVSLEGLYQAPQLLAELIVPLR